MPARVSVFRGVAIRRVVATERGATSLARPQVQPTGADLQALFALPALRLFDARNRIDVGTGFFRHGSLNPLDAFSISLSKASLPIR